MSKLFMRSLFATTALTIALPTAAMAQAAPVDESASATDDGAIIVTARRSDEKLQDVPVSVQAISGNQLQKLAITSADELSKLAPGLTLVNNGTSTQVTLRGVAWRPGSGTPATPIYFNEVPFDPGQTVVSLFDIGQIEVLRGPQGTSRGAPSISGAITITTKKPDLTEFGGFAQGLYGSANHWDVQVGINAPIIKDVLAIRLAANIENSEGTRVYSIHSTIKPSVKDRSFRATVLFKPTNTLTIEAMYQRRKTTSVRYDQVVGTGSPGYPGSPVAFLGALGPIPANFNGPALTIGQRAAVQDVGNLTDEHIDLLTVNAGWEVFGQKLSVNYGRQFNRGKPPLNANDPLNMLPGYELQSFPTNLGLPAFSTYEVRLSSQPNPDRPFDYDIGWFAKHSQGSINNSSPVLLAGAFGGPTALPGAVTTPNPAYILPINSLIDIGQVFDSFYGDVRFHIDDRTELSGGLAIVRDRVPVSLNVVSGGALNNIGNLNVVKLGFPAAFQPLITSCFVVGAFAGANIIPSAAYPGTCDAVVPAGSNNQSSPPFNPTYSRALYNFSLSHKFTDDVMAYATTGSSYRSGLPALGNVGLPNNLFVPETEGAKSYEIGVKTTWGRTLHVNAAVFQIDYKNQLTSFQGVTYWNSVASKTATTGVAFYRNVDSQVRGFELEVAAQPTKELSLGANISYSSIKSKGGIVPCNIGPAITAANPINFCTSAAGQVLNQDAPWQATVNGSYTVPLGSLDGYFRFNLSYKGNNPNYGNFPDAVTGAFKPTPAYAILDLYAGLTGEKNVWELGFYAKNVFDKQVELARTNVLNNVYAPFAVAPSGYNTVSASRPRELGISLRYSFGSR